MKRLLLCFPLIVLFIAPLMYSQERASAVLCTTSGDLETVENVPGDECPEGMTAVPLGACEVGDNSILGIPTWYKYLDGEIIAGKCKPVIDGPTDALPIALAVFEAALSAAGIVAVVMIFVGAVKFVLTQGEPEKAAAARKTVVNTIIGLVIIIISSRVVSYIASTIGGGS